MSDLSFRVPEAASPASPPVLLPAVKPKLLILIVAYNAEKTIASVLARVPPSIAIEYDVEVLVIDDASRDRTFERGNAIKSGGSYPFALTVLFNPVNQG